MRYCMANLVAVLAFLRILAQASSLSSSPEAIACRDVVTSCRGFQAPCSETSESAECKLSLVTVTHQGGIGAVVDEIIFGASFARYLGIQYGGMVPTQRDWKAVYGFWTKPVYGGSDRRVALAFLFGDDDANRLANLRGPQDLTAARIDSAAFPNIFNDGPFSMPKSAWTPAAANASLVALKEHLVVIARDASRLRFEAPSAEPPHALLDAFLTRSFLADLRAGPLACNVARLIAARGLYMDHRARAAASAGGARAVVTIAAHVRRGDVWENPSAFNYFTGDEYYYRVLPAIRQAVGLLSRGAAVGDVHAFTSCVGPERCARQVAAMGPGYASRRIALHVTDEADPSANVSSLVLSDWAHLMAADVLVTAVSSFSHVAGLLSQGGCVVYMPMWRGPLAGWVVPSREDWDTTMHKARPRYLNDTMLAAYFADVLPACLPSSLTKQWARL